MASRTATDGRTPDPISLIGQARERHDDRAKALQQARNYFALAVAFVGPIAVSLLATHVLLSERNSPLPLSRSASVGLIVLECSLLLTALVIGFLELGGSHKQWIKERLRTELLRREEFLLLARVGPYLSAPEEDLQDRVCERLLFIDSEINDPLDLIAMKDSDQSWKDALEDARASSKLTAIPIPQSAALHYLEDRIACQRKYFSGKSTKHRHTNELLEAAAKLVLILALVLSVVHLMTVLLPSHPLSRGWEVFFSFLLIAAISSPAFGALFDHLASIFGSERLSRSYLHHAEVLEEMEGRLRRLQVHMAPHLAGHRDAQFRFMRLVLEVEELLSSELRFWWLLMYPNLPKAAA